MNNNPITRFLMLLNNNIEQYLLLITYFYITFIIVIGVFNRFVLKSSSGWEEETARLLFIWLSWLGASLAVKRRSHIRLDFIYQYVSTRVEGLLYAFSDLVIILFCIVAFNAVLPVLRSTMNYGASLVTLQLSQIFFQIGIPFGLALIVIRAVQLLISDTRDIRNGNRVYQGESLFGMSEEES